jgi:hypothetical protein
MNSTGYVGRRMRRDPSGIHDLKCKVFTQGVKYCFAVIQARLVMQAK